jgi:murein DD-endopeptidase MepM/ murein hydrolase activator NlpD
LDLGYANLNTLSEASFESQDQISLGNKDFASVAVLQAALDEELDSHEPSPKPTLRLTNYFIQPARGTNWGILHAHNAVDIANVCGTSVVASAAGIVTESSGEGNWNGGYGNYVVLEHPNGVKTKYAHLGTVGVSLGDEVRQGDGIGTIGATGHVVGATGCHLHFEVLGAVNPFVRR